MEDTQIRTNTEIQQIKESADDELSLLNMRQEQWITFCALGGLITMESDNKSQPQEIKQMTITEFAKLLGVNRRTLYDWKKSIPSFAERVRARRYEIFSVSRETAAFNRLYLIGMTGKSQPAVDALKTLLGHFSRLDLPVQRQEIEAGENLLDMWARVEQRKAIEADAAEIDRGAGRETA